MVTPQMHQMTQEDRWVHGDLTIIQADREAAAKLAESLDTEFQGNDVAAIRNGIWDDGELGSIVQDFARHRIAFQNEA